MGYFYSEGGGIHEPVGLARPLALSQCERLLIAPAGLV